MLTDILESFAFPYFAVFLHFFIVVIIIIIIIILFVRITQTKHIHIFREDLPFNEVILKNLSKKNIIIDKESEIQNFNVIIMDCLVELSEEFQIMIILRDFQELSYDVISNIMEIPIGTVKSRINRGRIKLVALLKEKGYNKND